MRPAEHLKGLILDGGWHVDSIFSMPQTSTGGHYSVGYFVSKTGRKAYLKALDFSSALSQKDWTTALQDMLAAYNFEVSLLKQCNKHKLRRVVTPLDYGTVKVPGYGQLENVAYVIFELAGGNVRAEVAKLNQFDLAWSLRTLHHTATGLSELHSVGIAHQDLKPSNVLLFPDKGAKLSDLGNSSFSRGHSQLDSVRIPGDPSYAPPEQQYGWRHVTDFNSRYVADLYLLGSMVFFHFTRIPASTALYVKVHDCQDSLPGGEFLQDLPYLQSAFASAVDQFEKEISSFAKSLTGEIVMIARQLCEPDPRRRGDPNTRLSGRQQHDLQSYVSRFDRLATRAEMKIL